MLSPPGQMRFRDKCVLTHPVPVATKSERKLTLMGCALEAIPRRGFAAEDLLRQI
jgi:hypothetical protein